MGHPTDLDPEEMRARQFGRRCFIGGVTFGGVSLVGCLVIAILSEQALFHTRAGQLFGVLGIVMIGGLSLGLVLVGGLERMLRPVRGRQRYLAGVTDRLRILIERMAIDQEERDHVLMGLIAPLPGRLSAIEKSIEKVPAVSDAFLAGMTLRAKVDDDNLGDPDRR